MDAPRAQRGWYADPGGSGEDRYWNGEAWTNATRPADAAPPVEDRSIQPHVQPTSPAAASRRTRRSMSPRGQQLLVLGVVVLIGAIAIPLTYWRINRQNNPAPSALEQAAADCGIARLDGVEMIGGSMLNLAAGRQKDAPAPNVEDAMCVLQAIDMPASDLRLFENDAATGGVNRVTWQHHFASWVFDPKSGMHVQITDDRY